MIQLRAAKRIAPRLAGAGRNLPEKCFDQCAQVRLHLAIAEVGAHKAHAAVDVVADAARGDDAPFIWIGGANAADRKAVAPVDVRHRQAGMLNTRQESDVRDLLGRLVLLELCQERLAGENEAIHAHAGLVAFGDAVAADVNLFERARVDFFGHGSGPRGTNFQLVSVF